MKLKMPSRAAVVLTGAMFLLVATTITAQQLSPKRSSDETTARLVADMVGKYHIGQRKIDDRISKKFLARYLETLDPQKLYFTHSDVSEFGRYETELDDLVKVGNVEFAHDVYNRYLDRLKTRVALAHELIDTDHEFTVDESIVKDPKDLSWAVSEAEIQDRWRLRIKSDLLALKLADAPSADLEKALEGSNELKALNAEPPKEMDLTEAREQLHKRYDNFLKTEQQTSDSEKLEMYLSSLTHCFDPHSSYMSPEILEDFRISMELSLEGIGAALRAEEGFTIVNDIVPGGAADKDGRLKPNDRIIAVAQGDGEFVDVVEMKLNRVVRLIRGKGGTVVQLRVKTADTNEVKVYDLTRQKIELTSQAVRGEIIESGKRFPGEPNLKLGVINVPSFYRDFRGAQNQDEDFRSTARDVRQVLLDFHEKGGVDAVVVDLRFNGGGALSEAIEVTGLFIDNGPVVLVKDQNGRVKPHDDLEDGAYYTGPLVVLCNRLSASASEIFAGAIKDYGRGIVIGDTTTHGKGTVQNVMPVSPQFLRFLNQEDRGALKLTINKFYRVNGETTQKRGVPSDVVLPSLLDHMELGEEFLDNALEYDRIEEAEHDAVGFVTPEIVSTLKQSSQQRISADTKFQEVEHQIARFLERKKETTITLNEAKLREQREKDKEAAEEAEPDEEETPAGQGPVLPDGHYNDEVLRISMEYAQLVNGLKTARSQ